VGTLVQSLWRAAGSEATLLAARGGSGAPASHSLNCEEKEGHVLIEVHIVEVASGAALVDPVGVVLKPNL